MLRPLPIQSFLRNDIMSNSDFIAAAIRPCVKCGAMDRYASGDCRPCAKLRDSAYCAGNPEKRKATYAAYHAANPEERKAKAAAWRVANPDRVSVGVAAWARKNPDARRIYKQNRRARKTESGGTLSRDLSEKLFKLQKGMCPCCALPLGNDYHLDHKMPLALGGANEDDNMQLLRKICNLQKSAKHPIQFMQERGYLI